MKKIFYSIYAFMFNILSVLPIKLNKITFLSPHNEGFNDSLGAVMEEVIRRDEFIVVKISSNDLNIDFSGVAGFFKSIKRILLFFTSKAYNLATSKYIFLNDNFMPMAKLRFKSEAVITQLWHAEGAFKKFGFYIDIPEEIRNIETECNKKLTYVVCSSEQVKPIYAEAFGVSDYKVLPLGAPRTDAFFKSINKSRLREQFDKRYPDCKDKRLVLYAPTFRDNRTDDRRLLNSIDADAFKERFPNSCLLIRLHPQVHTDTTKPDSTVDVSDYENVTQLMLLADILITDYSSICMDFAFLEKPVYFYAFDLDKYTSDRSFFYEYETYVPGPVARDFQTLLNLINSNVAQTYRKRMYAFKSFNFGNPDGKSAKKVVDRIIYDIED